MPELKQLASLSLLGNSWLDWSIALAIALFTLALLLTLRRLVRRHSRKLQATERTELLEIPTLVLGRTTILTLAVVSIFIGAQLLTIGPKTLRVLDSGITIALFWQAGVWAIAAASAWLDRKRERDMATDRAAASSIGVIAFVLKVAIWAMIALLTLDNLGVNVTALVAGLGVGGIAVALAVQNVLGDLFASLSITLDRPFVVGDFLSVGEFLGNVEYIGIKSTRLRSLGGEQIVMSNSDLLGSRVRNYGRMSQRRVVFGTSVTYETPIELLERIPQLIRSNIEAQQDTRFDRCHFATHAAASLDFETVYYVLSADFNRYMDIQQAINLRLHRELAQLGVEFAYPTQRVFVMPAGAADSPPDGGARTAA